MAKLDSGAMTIGNNDNWREIFDDQNATAQAANQATADLAPIINGKRCALSVASGGYVLLRNSTITGKADGAYTAAKAIPANTDLDGSYLTAISGGVANALNSKITNMVIEFGTSSKELTPNLTDNWRTAVPNDSRVYFVRIDSTYGAFYGVICRYSDVYGTGVVSRYDGRVYRIQMDNGSCSSYQLQNRPIQVLSTGSKTISGNGNIGYTFSNKVLVLGAYSTSSDIVCNAYPSSGADSSGSAEWWIHCRNANSSNSVASGTITCYIIYIDMA